ncbi:unnamed protein product [Phaedon cochleariae]|uniref:UDP-glucuronosyltransferase n=1 Tax=Phaedon cochleariae TaxID=80249 RepID=A0A9N9X3Q4_PHACE|nr:unnamed protein product [Phaedon cochleariae]
MILPIICFLICSFNAQAAKILGVFPVPSASHQAIFQPIWRELSLRGHQITVVTPNPIKDPQLTNLTEIDVSFTYEYILKSPFVGNLGRAESVWERNHLILESLTKLVEDEIEFGEVQDLLNGGEAFDLVILQVQFMTTLVYGFAARQDAPIVAISSLGVYLHTHDAFGNPTHPLVSPDHMLNYETDLSFLQKVGSLLYNFGYRMLYYWYVLPRTDKIARKYFGDDIPYLGDIERNTSLLLMNVNPIMNGVRPNVPNIIEINHVHITDKKPLPKDIQRFLDSSPQGVIYFSLGSNVKSANLPTSTRNVFIQALANLPYKVLWKWEADYLPAKPDNVMIRKWLPQQDILGHPNIKVFLTQGGLQSIEESIINEVPMVGIPFMTDQPTNIKKMVDLGFGIGLDHRTMTKEQLRDAISEVAENKKYKEKVKKSKKILVDQPMKGVEKAVWWIEYVLRHKGAKHLRSAAADMTFYEYFMIDVIVFLLVCFSIFVYVIFQLLRLIVRLTSRTRKINQ